MDERFIDAAGMKAVARLDRRHRHRGGAEQHGIDGVEIVIHSLEALVERAAIIARVRAGELARQVGGVIIGAGDEELGVAAIDNGVIGAAHRREGIAAGRRERRHAEAVHNALQRKFERMRLVQRHFQHARHHLNAASQALRWRIEKSEVLRRKLAVVRDLLHQRVGRRRVRLQHENRAARLIAIVKLLKQLFLPRDRPAGAGAEHAIGRLAFAMREVPPGILAGEAGDNRVGGGDLQRPSPGRCTVPGRQRDVAQTAHADLGYPQAGLDAAARLDPGIDQQFAKRASPGRDSELGSVRQQLIEQPRGARIHAHHLAHDALAS